MNAKNKDYNVSLMKIKQIKNFLKIRYGILLIVFIILMAGVTFFVHSKLTPEKKVHFHAGFVVFQNNKKLDFSTTKYMYIKPCTLKGKDDHKNEDNEDNQLEKAHLHDNVGDVVHIESRDAIWKDLFTNIKFPLDYGKTEGFINGKKTGDYQSKAIQPYDNLVVFIGKNDIVYDLQQTPTKAYIKKMANKSTTCTD